MLKRGPRKQMFYELRSYVPKDRASVVARLGPVIAELYPGGDGWLLSRLDDVERRRALSEVVVGPRGLAGIAIETPKSRHRVKLSTLWVAEDARRQGVGAALVDARRRDWLQRGVREAAVTARQDIASELGHVLLPRGFDVVEIEADRYGAGEDEAVFVWQSRRDRGDVARRRKGLRWDGHRLVGPDDRLTPVSARPRPCAAGPEP